MKRICSLLLLVTVLSAGCYYDKEEELYGAGCNVANVTFTTTVNSLLQQHGCLGCHSGVAASGNVRLDGYANVKLNAPRIYGAVSHAAGFKPMPQGGAKLSDCEIKKIKSWIDAGMPE